MTRLLKLLFGAVVAFALLMVLSGLAIRIVLSGSGRDAVLSVIESRLNAPVSIEGGDFDLAQWFRFTPAITLRGFLIGNPQGFSSGNMIEADEVSAQVALLPMFSDRVEIHSVILRRPQFHLETDAQGRSNLSALFPASPAGESEPAEDVAPTQLAIHSLTVEDGALRYVESGGAEPLSVEGIHLLLSDFSADTSCRFELTGRLFGAENCPIRFAGNAGPFSETAIPCAGDMEWELAPAEVPAAIRQKYFGDVMAEPGGDSRVGLSAKLNGDLFGTMRGNGELSFVEFQIGPNAEDRLELAGQAPLELTAQRLLGAPAIQLGASGATLQLGSGQWQGNTEFRFADSQLKGYVNGAISGVDINQFLTAFSGTKDRVFGTAQMPDLRISFAGGDPATLLSSLSGDGTLTMEDGRIVALDIFNSVMAQAQKMLSSETAASGETSFVRFFSRWQIGGRRLQMSEILLDGGSSSLSGEGFLTFAQELNFDLRTTITGPVAANLGGRPNEAGVPSAQIPVKVSGTLEAPRLRPDIKQVAQEQVKQRVGDLLDSLFKKRNQ
jgi:hypothetical protein